MSFRNSKRPKNRKSSPGARAHSARTRGRDERERRNAGTLWPGTAPTRPGPKAMLTPEQIARTAIAIADADGLAGVSMSRVAEGLGFTTMALYRYVPGKSALVDLMFDTAMGTPADLDLVSGEWRARIEHWARGLWALMIAHPWSLEVLSRLRLPGPNELAWMECGVRALDETGLKGAALLDALVLIVGHVRTVAQYAVIVPEASGNLTTTQWAAGVHELLHRHASRFPALAAATDAGAFAPVDDPLAFGLERVLDGIALLVATSMRATRDVHHTRRPQKRNR
jgi:AcrR family transcriptional regulator